MQQSKVFVSGCVSSTWWFRIPGSLYVEAVPISGASSPSVSIQWEKKENGKQVYLFLTCPTTTPLWHEKVEFGGYCNFLHRRHWLLCCLPLSSDPPFLGLMLFPPVGNIVLFLGLVILGKKSIPQWVTWVFGEIKLHILPNGPLLLRTHVSLEGWVGWFAVIL